MGNQTCCVKQEEGGAVLVAQMDSATPPPAEPEPSNEAVAPKEAPAQQETKDEKLAEIQAPKEEPTPLSEARAAGSAAGVRKELRLTFLTTGGQETVVTFTRKPLGLDFYRSLPIKIKRVHEGSDAQAFGIQPQMQLVKLDDVETAGKALVDMHDMLKKAASELPSKTA